MDLQQGLWSFSFASECVAFLMIVGRGLARPYQWFTSYLGFGVLSTVIVRLIGKPGQTSYAVAWMIAQPIALGLLVLTTNEIVRKIPEHYRGFGEFGKTRLRWLLKAAIIVAFVSSVIEAAGPYWKWSLSTLLPFILTLGRITTSTLAVYLLLVAAFVAQVRVPFRRNLLIHSSLFGAYLWLQTAVTLWAVILGHGTPVISNLLTAGSAVIFILWAALLTRSGEALPPRRALSAADIAENERQERALTDAATRYSDRPLG